MPNSSTQPKARRRGAALVEFAFVVPILFLLVFGLIEFSRMAMVYHVITNAAREGCRQAVLPGATASNVTTVVNSALNDGKVTSSSATVVITPSNITSLDTGTPISVRVTVNYSAVSWIPSPDFLTNKLLQAECVMLREAK